MSLGEKFLDLQSSSFALNLASDELNKSIEKIDSFLKTLNIGIPVWVEISRGEDKQSNTWWVRRAGYAKVNGKWGISLHKIEGKTPNLSEGGILEDYWLFADSPRWARMIIVEKIPEILTKLVDEANKTTSRLRLCTEEVKGILQAMNLKQEK